MMIATAVPARRREVLAIDMDTVLRLPRPFVNPLAQLIDGSVLGVGDLLPFCQLPPNALGGAGIHKWANRSVHPTGHHHYLLSL
jgi:hypothetical protein